MSHTGFVQGTVSAEHFTRGFYFNAEACNNSVKQHRYDSRFAQEDV